MIQPAYLPRFRWHPITTSSWARQTPMGEMALSVVIEELASELDGEGKPLCCA